MNEFESELKIASMQSKARFIRLAFISIISIFLVAIFLLATKSFHVELSNEEPILFDIEIIDGLGLTLNDRVFPIGKVKRIKISSFGYVDEFVDPSNYNYSHISIKLIPRPINLSIKSVSALKSPRWLVDGKLASKDPEFKKVLLPGVYSISLLSLNYEKMVMPVTLVLGVDQDLSVTPTPSIVELSVDTDPSGLDVLVDGASYGASPIKTLLSAGTHTVSIDANGYEAINDVVDLDNSRPSYSRNYNLDSIKSFSNIKLFPKGGSLRVNGKSIDNKKAVVLDIKGENTISYAYPGYQSKTLTIDGYQDTVSISLEPIFVDVSFEAMPSAELYIDGDFVGTTPLTQKMLSKNYTVVLKSDSYLDLRKQIRPRAGVKNTFSYRLESIKDNRLRSSPLSYKNAIGVELLRIAPAEFTMGTEGIERSRRSDEFLRKVSLTRHFYIAKHEVTNSQYQAFFNDNIINNKPVTNISWNQAAAFCNWLSIQEGLEAVYFFKQDRFIGANLQRNGYRLPTEAEWEYLARRHNKPQITPFVWGKNYATNELVGNLADANANGVSKTYIASYNDGSADVADVGSYPVELSGIYDQSGNVSEWVHDYYSFTPPKKGLVFKDYAGPKNPSDHIVKGSNYLSSSWTELRAGYKSSLKSSSKHVGFRVARYIY